MVTELRDFGDKETIVVYTNDNQMYHNLSRRKKCFKIIPYTQEPKGKETIVGYDLYFPKAEKQSLLKLGCVKT